MGIVQSDDRLQTIMEKLESITNIPTIPLVATRAMRSARDSGSSMRDIAEIISTDPPLAARVLKVVNSAYYGLRQSVGSLPLALTILGIREIINLVMGLSLMTIFPDSTRGGLFNRNEFWKHSAATAQIGKMLTEKLGFSKLASEVFVGGLLHDIGKIIMDEHMHKEFCSAIELSVEEGLPLHDAESMLVGATHPQIGAWLSKKWKLPENLVVAISHHHSPQKLFSDDVMKQIVYIANILCNAHDAGESSESIVASLLKDPIWDICTGSSRREINVKKIVEGISEEIEKTSSLIS